MTAVRAGRLVLLALALGSVACAPRVRVARLKPAEVNLKGIKQIAVLRIDGRGGDTLAGLITQKVFDSKRYEVVERNALDTILREHRLTTDAAFQQGSMEFGKLLPAAALISGHVDETNVRDDVTREKSTCSRRGSDGKYYSYPCTKYVRRASVNYAAHLKVLDTNTGRILATKTLRSQKSDSSSAYDEDPRPIDTNDMLQACREAVASDFLKVIAPYTVMEEVILVEDGDLPSLKVGNNFAKANDWESAKTSYAEAVARAGSTPNMAPKTKGKAHYALGLALVFTGEYDAGISQLQQANNLHSDDDWMELLIRAKQFKADADKVKEQTADAEPAPSAMLLRH